MGIADVLPANGRVLLSRALRFKKRLLEPIAEPVLYGHASNNVDQISSLIKGSLESGFLQLFMRRNRAIEYSLNKFLPIH